jgi:hemolysin activation/secretion protein
MGFVSKVGLIGSVALGLTAAAGAQQIRPSDERPELQEFAPSDAVPSPLSLPPLPAPPRLGRTSSGQSLRVREFRVVGSTVFSPQEIAEVTRPFENRDLLSSELQDVRDALTNLYVERGYRTSGAMILDQSVSDGVVEIQIIEGELEDLSVETSGRLRPGYIEERIRLGVSKPVDVHRVEERLQLLQEDPRVARIDAELLPGRGLGYSELRVSVQEANPWRAMLEASNERSPAVGSEGVRTFLQHRDLTGNGDVLSLYGERSKGFDDLELRYGLPLNARDTTLELRVERSSSEIVEDPFDDLEIESDSVTYGLTLTHPLVRAPGRDLKLGLTAEHRRSDTNYVFGSFPFTPGSDDGEVKLTVLRFFQDWTARAPERVVAARSTFNLGLDALRATNGATRDPDGRFFAWLGQAQIAQRLPGRFQALQLLLRADAQLTSEPLLSLEQFALGGLRTVRGYRENELVRDNAWVASVELRVPVLIDADGLERIELRPFVDVGKAWNERSGTANPADEGSDQNVETLASIGAGLVLRPTRRLQLEAYWGGRLRQIEERGDDIQNHGWHFVARLEY